MRGCRVNILSYKLINLLIWICSKTIILNEEFTKEVNLLDERFKIFLKNVSENDASWWKEFDVKKLVKNNSIK
jgi:hypothetical protein